MSRFSARGWLQRLVKKSKRAERRSSRLRVEELEDRLTPASLMWTGNGADNNWNTAANWSPNALPGNGDDLLFPAGAARLTSVNNIAGLGVNSIAISGTGYTIQGLGITLGSIASGSGFINVNGTALNDTINFDTITLGGALGDKQFLTVNSSQSVLTISSPISGNTGVELSKIGSGTLILSGNNSYTGPVTITEGAINARTATALGTTSQPTTVLYDSNTGKFGQLQIESLTGNLAEPLILNGSGALNDGALLNVAGANTITGKITLDSNTMIGAKSGSSLTLQGLITDLGAGQSLTKEGAGTVTLDPLGTATGNSYRGQTIVNDGILAIRHSLALGNDAVPAAGVNDTIVNSFTNRSGTLQLDFVANPARIDPNATASGFTVPREILTLNGPGVDGIHVVPKTNAGATVTGALNNRRGTNTWVQDIQLWSDDSALLGDINIWVFAGFVLPTVGIGVESNSQLTITGHVRDANLSGTGTIVFNQYSLIKTRPGRLVFVHDNSYRGKTEILEGYLRIQDSDALGTGTNNITNGTFVFPQATLELEADSIDDSQSGSYTDPQHGLAHLPTDIIITNELIRPMGSGANNDGAIRNIRGVNELTGNIQNQRQIPRTGVTFNDNGSSIGVVPDYTIPGNYASLAAPFDDPLYYRSQLTVSGLVQNDPSVGASNLIKYGQGELVLTSDNTYTGRTFISEGWITARSNFALGGTTGAPDTLQPETYIADGAALVLKRTRDAAFDNIKMEERLFVSGTGISHPAEPILYPSETDDEHNPLNKRGAILNLSGFNTITGIITLVGNATSPQVGLGADIDSTDPAAVDSVLRTGNLVRDDITANIGNTNTNPGSNGAYPYPIPNQPFATGIIKLGRKSLWMHNQGTFGGDNDVKEGVLRVTSDTALGGTAGTTTVDDGAALEVGGYLLTFGAGFPAIMYNLNGGEPGGIQVFENLVLNGPGNESAADNTHDFSNQTLTQTLTNLSDDNMWRSPVTLNSDVNIDVQADSRLSFWKTVSGAGGFTKNSTGELVLGGVNSYDGVTTVAAGTLNLQSSSALGSALGGTVVANDAQLQLQGDITIGGESLTIEGNGPNAAPNLPLRWFGVGPGPITDATWAGSGATGRVTATAVDPSDPNIIYVTGSDGSLWVTKNNGVTWQPLLDADVAGAAAPTNQVLFTGAMAVAAGGIIYVAQGEANNSADSFYGRGILRSADYGQTWSYVAEPAPLSNYLDRRTVAKIVIDPGNSNTIYLAVSSRGTNGLGGTANGIWRCTNAQSATPTWVNMTQAISVARAAASPPPGPGPDDNTDVTFLTSDQYTDVVVLPDRANPNNRFIIFDLWNPSGVGRTNVNGNQTGVGGTYVSIDNGASWNLKSFTVNDSGNEHSGSIKTAGGFTPDQNFNDPVASTSWQASYTLYSATTNPGAGTGLREIWKTTITWDTTNLIWVVSNWATQSAPPNYMASQGDYDNVIAVRPDNVNYVFLGGVGQPTTVGPFVSINGAGAWTDIGTATTPPHVNYHASTWENNSVPGNFVTVPFANPAHLVVGTDGGVWRLANGTPGSIQWANLNGRFLNLTQINAFDVDPFNPFAALVGTQGNGTIQYADNPTWTNVDNAGGLSGNDGSVQINNNNPAYQFYVRNGTLRRSTTGGASGSWANVNVGGGAGVFILDRTNPARLLVAVGTNVRETADATLAAPAFNTIGQLATFFPGTTSILGLAVADRQGFWQADNTDFPLALDNGADSYDSNTIYAIMDTGVAVTKNHGSLWVRRNGTGANTLNTSNLSDIWVDPLNRDVAYVTRSSFNGPHVYQTLDAGRNWTDITGNLPGLPTWTVVTNRRTVYAGDLVHGHRSDDVYVGTDNGVYVMHNNAPGTWTRVGAGMPNVQVRDLEINTYTNMLSAGTYGRGLFQMWLDESRADSGAIRAITGASLWTGPVTLTGNTDMTVEIGATLELSGKISDDVPGGNYDLNKQGTGRLVFSGPNDYGGVTHVNAGELTARNKSALGLPTGNTIVVAGAALELQADLAQEPVQLNGDGIQINGHNTGALRNVSNNNTYTGPLTLETDATIGVDSGSQLTIGTKAGLAGTGSIDEDGNTRSLTKELTGTLVLNTANTYMGLTDIIQGAIRVLNAQALGTTDNGAQVRNGAQLQINSPTSPVPDITVVGEQLDLSGTGIFGTGALLNESANNEWQGPIHLRSLAGIPAPQPPTPPNRVAFGANANSSLLISDVISQQGGTFGLDKVLPGKVMLRANNTYAGATTVYAGVLSAQDAHALGTFAPAASAGTTVLAGAALELDDFGSGGISYVAEPLTLNGDGVSPANLGALRNTQGNNTWTGTITLAADSTLGADAATQLTVTGVNRVISASGIDLKKAGPGTVVFANDNNLLLGTVNVNNGALNIRSPHALGPVGSDDTTVNSTPTRHGSLQIEGNGLVFADEFLTLNGPGFNNAGALENVAGANTWAKTITLGSDAAIGVDVGGDRLIIDADIVDNGNDFGVAKVGLGTLEYAGALDNTYTGLTQVNLGVLDLNKDSPAIPFGGDLTVGDTVAGLATALLSQSDEIPDAALVMVLADGLLDINSQSDSVDTIQVLAGEVDIGGGTLTVADLVMQGGLINIASGTLDVTDLDMTAGRIQADGVVTLEGGTMQFRASATASAVIDGSGYVDLNDLEQVFDVEDGPHANPFTDLKVDAEIRDTGSNGALDKDGPGVMEINSNGASMYTGLTDIFEGKLLVNGTLPGEVDVDGGTLGGNGTVGFVQGTDGFVNPGPQSPTAGKLNTTDDVDLDGLTFFVDLNDSNTQGVDYDWLNVANTKTIFLTGATLSGLVNSSNIGVGETFTIITAGTVSGHFDNDFVDQVDNTKRDVFIDGRKFQIQYNPTSVVLTRVKNNVLIQVTPSVANPVWGQEVTYTATLTPETGTIPNGESVSFNFTTGPQPPPPSVPPLPGAYLATVSSDTAVYYPFHSVSDPQAGQGYILQPTTPSTTYTLVVSYAGDADFVSVNQTLSNLTVAPANTAFQDASNISRVTATSNPSQYGSTVTLAANVDVLAPGGVWPGTDNFALSGTGTITFFVDNTQVGSAIAVNNTGFAQTTVTNLGVGGHLVRATYNGDPYFKSATTNIDTNLVITKASTQTTVSATPNPVNHDVSTTFSVHVASAAGTPGGAVVLRDNGNSFATINLDINGDSTYAISTLAAGHHTITAQYLGSTNFDVSTSNPYSFIVRGDTTTAVTANPSGPSTVGNSVTFVATVKPVAPATLTVQGSVKYYYDSVDAGHFLGSANLNGSGVASLPTNLVPFGTHTIYGVYQGDAPADDYLTSTGSMSQTVKGNSQVILTAVPNTFTTTFGQSVTFTATVSAVLPASGTPSGNVQFLDGATVLTTLPLVGGTIDFTTSGLSVGQHTITAKYLGETLFNGNQDLHTQTVKSNTNVQVNSSLPAGSTYGQQVTFTATVSPVSPTSAPIGGFMRFVIDGTAIVPDQPVTNGVATLPISTLNASPTAHVVTVSYLGDTLFNPTAGGLVGGQIVNPADTTTAMVGSSPRPSAYGQLVTFTTTVSAVSPGVGPVIGTVTFDFDSGARQQTVNLLAAMNGMATLQLTDLVAGAHQVRATYNSNGNFNTSTSNSSPLSHTVNQTATSMQLTAVPSTSSYGVAAVTAKVIPTAPGGGVPSGNVIFALTNLGSNVTTNVAVALDGSGVAALPPAVVGNYRVSASYAANTNYGGSSAGPVNFSVIPTATTLSLASTNTVNAVYGEPVITAKVTPNVAGILTPTGNVTFTVRDTINNITNNYSASLVGGTATLPIPLPVGTYSIDANFFGDGNFLSSANTTSLNQVISKANSTLSVVGSTSSGSNVVISAFGQNVVFTIDVVANSPGSGTPTGSVQIQVDAEAPFARSLVNGEATFSRADLIAGGHTILVNYAGDSNFNLAPQSSHAHTVNPATTKTTVSSSVNASFFGQNVNFTAIVASVLPGLGTPTGSVNFIVDGNSGSPINKPLAGGQAVYSTTGLAVGFHTIEADYVPDTANFDNSVGTLNPQQQVKKGNTQTVVNSSANPSPTGTNVTFTATVNPIPGAAGTIGGSVRFVIDGGAPVDVSVSGGQAQTNATFNTQGGHSVLVTYLGDGNFNSSASSMTQLVKSQTTTNVAGLPNSSIFSQNVVFTATVALSGLGVGTPTGNVQFVIDGGSPITRPISGGQATFNTSTLSATNHIVIVNYLGDGNFLTSSNSSTPYTQTVLQGTTHTTLTVPGAGVIGQSLSLSAKVTPDNPSTAIPTGTVTFVDSVAGPLGAPVNLDSGGVATLPINSLVLGGHTITATYNGSSGYASGSSDSKPITINAANTNVVVSGVPNTVIATQSVVISAAVNVTAPGSAANATPQGSVNFFDATTSTALGSAPVISGVATLPANTTLSVGAHTIQATFVSSSSNFNNSPVGTTTVTVKPNPLVFAIIPASVKSGSVFTIVVRIMNANGTAVDQSFTGQVALGVTASPAGGTLSGTLALNAVKGVATFSNLKLDRTGLYTLRASIAGNLPPIKANINVTAAFLKYVITGSPTAGTPFKLTITAYDSTNHVATNFTGTTTLQVLTKPTSATVSGITATFVNGVATLNAVNLSKAGSYKLRAVLNGLALDIVFSVAGRKV